MLLPPCANCIVAPMCRTKCEKLDEYIKSFSVIMGLITLITVAFFTGLIVVFSQNYSNYSAIIWPICSGICYIICKKSNTDLEVNFFAMIVFSPVILTFFLFAAISSLFLKRYIPHLRV